MNTNAAILRIIGLSAVLAGALTSAAHAGPCTAEIDRMQARLDARLGAKAAAGPSAPEGTNALTHRQPTPGSVASAEEKLGEVSPQRAQAATEAMARARAADSAGEKGICQQALMDIEQVLSE
jgi:hypothetical protein